MTVKETTLCNGGFVRCTTIKAQSTTTTAGEEVGNFYRVGMILYILKHNFLCNIGLVINQIRDGPSMVATVAQATV